MTCVVIRCILKYIFSDLHLILLQLLCRPVKFTSETHSTQSCSDSALSLCRRILPGDRSCGTQWMIHRPSDFLGSAQHSQPTVAFAVVDLLTWMLQSHQCTQFTSVHKDVGAVLSSYLLHFKLQLWFLKGATTNLMTGNLLWHWQRKRRCCTFYITATWKVPPFGRLPSFCKSVIPFRPSLYHTSDVLRVQSQWQPL